MIRSSIKKHTRFYEFQLLGWVMVSIMYIMETLERDKNTIHSCDKKGYMENLRLIHNYILLKILLWYHIYIIHRKENNSTEVAVNIFSAN